MDGHRLWRFGGAAMFGMLLLAGCGLEQTSVFATNQEVALRAHEELESSPEAELAHRTVVVPAHVVGAEMEAWEVDTPAGTGWLNQRYIRGPMFTDAPPQPPTTTLRDRCGNGGREAWVGAESVIC